MSVRLNETALRRLLESDSGPVRRDIERRAEAAAAALNTRIAGIIDNPIIRPQAGFTMTEEGAIIGIRPFGKVSEYMGFKLERENWWEAVGRQAAS